MSADALALARLGQNKGTGSTDALFLDLGADELLTAFDKKKIFSSTVKEGTIKGGRSKRFIVTGRRAARYHTPGTIIDGTGNSPSDVSSRILYLDGLMIADETIYDLDELQEDPSTRAEIMHQLGEALADQREARIARVLFAAGNTSTEPLSKAINTGRTGDKITLTAGFSTASNNSKGDELAAAIKSLAILKRKKHVPMGNMVCVVTPDAAGWLADGTGDNANSAYAQDLSKCVGILYHRDAMGVLNLRRPKLQMTHSDGDYNVMYQSQLLVASMAIGMGVLAPECAGIIVTP
jgi:hypothetical protein